MWAAKISYLSKLEIFLLEFKETTLGSSIYNVILLSSSALMTQSEQICCHGKQVAMVIVINVVSFSGQINTDCSVLRINDALGHY